jgi:hypothetical protein
MRFPHTRHGAWALWAACLLLAVVSTVLVILNRSTATDSEQMPLLVGLGYAIIFLVFAGVGALIIAYQPRNVVGWSLYGFGMVATLVGFVDSYATYGLATNQGSVPGPAIAAWLSSTGNALIVVFIPPIFLYFPSGRLLSARWRWVVWLLVPSVLMNVLWNLNPGMINNSTIEVENPFAVFPSKSVSDVFGTLGLALVFVGIIAGLITLVLRFRRTRGKERQQLKWLAMTAGIMVLIALSAPILWTIPTLWSIVFVIGIGAIPTGVGIAILRHDLYDIDVIINKTLVYGALTAILVGADVLLVIGIEHLLAPVSSGSDLVVAGSTLAVAALIRPLRVRIQSVVDRRFYRHKYDATRTLEAFSSRLRDQTDLSALATELGAVVQETMQPAHVTLWVRNATGVSNTHLGGQLAQ